MRTKKFMKKSIVFAGGGTGGHIFPGLAVIEELKKRWEGKILWIGSYSRMENDLMRKWGIRFYKIPAGKMRRYISLRNVIDIFNVIAGIVSAFIILLREQPHVIFSKGGYVSVPVVIAGFLLRIPVITHESDLDPGIATKINAFFVKKICISYKETSCFFSGKMQNKIIYTGNPVRLSIVKGDSAEGRKILGCGDSKKVLLILGGSLGALAINKAIEQILDQLTKVCFVVHQMGQKHFQKSDKKNYFPVPFFDSEFPHILAAADLVVSRAGANTLWECATAETPSILIPLSLSSSRGDQIRNARLFQSLGISCLVEESPHLSEKLLETIRNLLDNKGQRDQMKEKARSIGEVNALNAIIELLLKFCV
ncbi:MAG: undecaprenyldiphospho-muramoylpentapeptide beta-N-acetylglucosaminyltransferase [Spirochaetales bacterium]|nr:undecaprenyldiphospho-muramoylpentapeptide beta-N-acetylglucosaminyltransferase [Spirochaetales bacterium]